MPTTPQLSSYTSEKPLLLRLSLKNSAFWFAGKLNAYAFQFVNCLPIEYRLLIENLS